MNAMRHALVACLAFGAMLPMGIASSAATAGELKICNDSAELKRISLVYRKGLGLLVDNWTAVGRYEIAGGSCETYFEGSKDAIVSYINILVPDGSGGLRDAKYPGTDGKGSSADFYYGDWIFCMNPNGPFEFSGTEKGLEICGPGTEQRVFSIYVSVEVRGRATLSLD